MNPLRELHKRCSRHREYLEQHKDELIGCFYCLRQFRLNDFPAAQLEWIQDRPEGVVIGHSLRCPFCSIDSVVYGNDALEKLEELKKFYF
jgi:hypothetical protein